MSSRLQILSATYRTLDVTSLVRNEVRCKKPFGTIKIEPWNVIPWSDRRLLDAPAPEVLVIAWRVALAGGLYTTPRLSTGEPRGMLEIKFDDDLFKESDHAEDIPETLSLINATYFDCKTGFRDVTGIVQLMFISSKAGPVAIPVNDSTFGGSAVDPDTNCKNQLTVTYWHKTSTDKVKCKSVSTGTGDTLCIERDADVRSGSIKVTVKVTETAPGVAAIPEKMNDKADIVTTVTEIPEVSSAVAA